MGLMSGKFQARFGVFNNVYGLQQNQLWIQQTTLADVLKNTAAAPPTSANGISAAAT